MPGGPVFAGTGSPQNAPGAVPALVLGILGIVLCPLCAPFAWWQGKTAETAASGGRYGGRGMATAGMIGVGLIALYVILFIVLVAIGVTSDPDITTY